jgi:hypothetical protein
MTNIKNPEEYRRFAKMCREAARSVSAEKERAELLARAKAFDFLAEHCPHHPVLDDRLPHGPAADYERLAEHARRGATKESSAAR